LAETQSPLRPLTRKARRRSWNEPAVRGWWLSAAGVFVVAAWLLVDQLKVIHDGRYRLDHWHRIEAAKIEKIGREKLTNFKATPETLSSTLATLSYTDNAGTTHRLEGYLVGQSAPLSPGSTIPILVDLDRPEHWTDRIKPLPVIEGMMGPLLLAPLSLGLAGVALMQRRRILKIWQHGIQRAATVVSVGNSATAPLSTHLRCTLLESRDNRIVTVTVPRAAFSFRTGDTVTLLTSPGDSNRAIAAVLYEGN
jgi:hypothetical protein